MMITSYIMMVSLGRLLMMKMTAIEIKTTDSLSSLALQLKDT